VTSGIGRAVSCDMTKNSCTILLAGVITSAFLTGCTAESRARVDSAKADSASSTVAPAATGVNADANATPPVTADSSRAGSMTGTGASSTTSTSFDHVGSLRVGMSAAEARKALGLPASSAKSGECRYLDTKGRSRVYVMLVHDTVARLDVRDSTIATPAGARIGDAESRVQELYRGRVKTEPHKYVEGGHYFIVASPSDTTRQLVFETDGKKVTSYRVGRTPEVRWVEGCS